MSSPAPSDLSLESGEWNDEDRSFYLDTHPTPFQSFDPDQSFEGYRYVFVRPQTDHAASGGVSSSEPLGSRMALVEQALNDAAETTARKQPLERRCFNCGEASHAVAQCHLPRNRERIRQSRLQFQESQSQQKDDGELGEINGHARLHEQVASAEQRLRWLDEMVPGQPSLALIEALTWDSHGGMDEAQQYGRGWGSDGEEPRGWDGGAEASENLSALAPASESSLDLPHLRNMLIWGYPPGWISSQDPIESIKQRIRCDAIWDSVEVLDGLDVAGLKQGHEPIPAGALQAEASEQASSRKVGVEERRWVDYHTHLFDSFRLQSFDTVFRTPLPQQRNG